MRLIDADALMELYADSKDFSIAMCNVPIPVVRQNILDMPTIEAEPVKHSAWERCGSVLCECQNCGEIYSMSGNLGKGWNYCPNCGAKMDVTDINVGNKMEG